MNQRSSKQDLEQYLDDHGYCLQVGTDGLHYHYRGIPKVAGHVVALDSLFISVLPDWDFMMAAFDRVAEGSI